MTSAEDLLKLQFTKSDTFNKYSIEQVEESLKKAGFENIDIKNFPGKKEHGYFIYAMKRG
jgi:hypothetical protein